MGLERGSKLGPYEILEPLGAGGMGEVYRARDTRLDREVAVKVLPDHLSASPEVRARFEREARSASSLNHPHICVVHDIGRESGVDYLVMELLEGETLAERLETGALPLDELLRIGAQLADALDRAHRRGLVHRDLKPGNIMLTRSGAKLMDFGLAKASEALSASSLTAAPTATSPLTAQGTLLGTIQYMAPEQLEGKEADARSDLFALGVVLYEMATGARAFGGATQASVIASILKEDPPPLRDAQPAAPRSLERLIRTCLAKDPDERWQSAGDLRRELTWIETGEADAPSPATNHTGPRIRSGLAGWVVAGLLLLALAAALFRPSGEPEDLLRSGPIRTQLPPPPGMAFKTTSSFSLSPDGTRVALAIGEELWLRRLDSFQAEPIPGTKGDAANPFWSQDGSRLGFFADGKLKVMDASGGPVTTLCDAPDARGGTWNADDVIVFTPSIRAGLFRISATGGEPVAVTEVDSSIHSTHRWPRFLEDGRHIVYLATDHNIPMGRNTGLYVTSLDGMEPKRIAASDGNPAFYRGHLLYPQQGSLLAGELNPKTLELEGPPIRVQNGVYYQGGSWRASYDVSTNDVLAVTYTGAGIESQLSIVNGKGELLDTVGDPTTIWATRVSPDGGKLAVARGAPEPDLFLVDLQRGTSANLTSGLFATGPVWSPDGTRIAFAALQENGRFNMMLMTVNAAGDPRLLQASDVHETPTDWSPDGRHVLFDRGPWGDSEVWVLDVEGAESFRLVREGSFSTNARFSSTGRWVVYTVRERGLDRVVATTFPDGKVRVQISSVNASAGMWSPDGAAIYYLGYGQNLNRVRVRESERKLDISAPEEVFWIDASRGLFRGGGGTVEMFPDGERLLLNRNASSLPEEMPISLVFNWSRGLEW